ncbi:MFS transporter [Pontibacter sp. E15-1]|uniref:MFS transporter n=1 Tax=Pontibacter sp. E15-1 TaxID=2919918 RepID=UPI001F4F27BD|nr:MFS transporter [Pontibacter sp. E15-1]MCJ8165990.1 MFS transporter [Pontibacter sp. E15-1]
MSDYNRGLFKDWVPKPLQLLLIIVFTVINISIGSVYTGNIAMMTGDLGTMPEYLVWANYAAAIGLAAALTLFLRVKMRFRVKETLVVSYSIVAVFSYIIATTNVPEVIVAASFIIGFFKIFPIMEFMLPLMAIISGEGSKGKFYAVFYPFAIILGNVSGYYIIKLAYQTTWQYPHYLTLAICLLLVMLSVVFIHEKRFSRKLPFSQVDWLSILLFSVSMMCLAYFFSFGKTLNWFQSESIRFSFWGMLVSFAVMTLRQLNLKRPYASFEIFTKSNVLNVLLLLAFTAVFLGTGSIQSIYTSGVLGYDAITNASLNLMMIPGVLIGGIVSYPWYKSERSTKMLIFSGFAAFFLYSVMMYFMMVPEMNYGNWFLPMMLKGYGMAVLFIAVWFYTLDKLPMEQLLQSIGLVMTFRSVITTALFTSLYSWLQYKFQWDSVNNLAVYFDGNLLSLQNALGGYKNLQVNAVLAANKKVFGLVSLAGLGIMVFVLQHHFEKLRFTSLRVLRAKLYGKRGKRKMLDKPGMAATVTKY